MTHRYVLPWPPSLNRYYRSVNGRVLISREGRQYRADVQMRLLGSPTIRTRCKVEIHACRQTAASATSTTSRRRYSIPSSTAAQSRTTLSSTTCTSPAST